MLQDVRAKYQQLPNPAGEDDADMPLDQPQVVVSEAMAYSDTHQVSADGTRRVYNASSNELSGNRS